MISTKNQFREFYSTSLGKRLKNLGIPHQEIEEVLNLQHDSCSLVETWSILLKDIELPIETEEPGLSLYTESFKKGSYIEVNKDNPTLYLGLKGDSQVSFPLELLHEVLLDPKCNHTYPYLPEEIRVRENYPFWFRGNPPSWFSSNTKTIFQGI